MFGMTFEQFKDTKEYELLAVLCACKGWRLESAEDVLDQLRELPQKHTEITNRGRHWTEEEIVVELPGNIFLAYGDAHTSSDMSPQEKGWELELGGVGQVYPHEIVKTEYRSTPPEK